MPVFLASGLTSWKAASESCSVSSVISMRVPPRVWTSLSCCCALAWQWKIQEKWRLQRGIFHWQQGKLSNSVTLLFQHMSQVSVLGSSQLLLLQDMRARVDVSTVWHSSLASSTPSTSRILMQSSTSHSNRITTYHYFYKIINMLCYNIL